ncbi:MAG: ferritin-like domain-containing protein [Acidobacteria bacterium]|nr:ferritin-like domain-containing protein [Acidobacteriota bacterium]
MPNRIPKAQADLGDLALHEGGAMLLRRAIAPLREGDLLEICGGSSELVEQLPAWCRQQGHRYLPLNKGAGFHWIERGASDPPLIRPAQELAETAEPAWGLAPRGATVEAGGPAFSFPLRRKREVWAEELDAIRQQAANNQWSLIRDISWNALPRLAPELEIAVSQAMTFLTENEFAALYIPARFLARIHPHYREVLEVLAFQVTDEARHAEAFTRRAEAGGTGLGTTANSGQLSLHTLLEESEFTTAVFLLCVMGEGTFLTLLQFLEENAPDPVTAALMRYAHRDEARHVAFGVSHLRYVLQREPERRPALAAAVERRSRLLASISGLSPYVHDALVILAGGGLSPEQVREGARRVAVLHREMDRARSERLQALGFSAEEAVRLSAHHTKNFM